MNSEEKIETPKPVVPDHTLIRKIGFGSYGEVWLARSSMGILRAIKIVHRSAFKDARPFERELSGIQKFEPISRSHEGFIDILHVGKNDDAGYFYYVMEIGDDAILGPNIDPESYSPRTLASEINLNGRLPVEECIRLGVALTQAVGQMHDKGLVHRDIKPSNIIFVNGTPKLADIGLVAERDQARSYVGTEGFIPPEGPGTPSADIYSLGKVLYECCTGMDRHDFPRLPDGFESYPDWERFIELNEVLLDACREDPLERHRTAWEFQNCLLLVAHGKSIKRLRLLERRMEAIKRFSAILGVVALVSAVVGVEIYQVWRGKENARAREIGKNIAYGNRLLDSGDYLGALPYFVTAFDLDRGNSAGERSQRLRIGSMLFQSPKLSHLWQEQEEFYCGAFRPDGKAVVVVPYQGQAKVFDLEDDRHAPVLFGPSNRIKSACYSLDGKWITTCSAYGWASIWNATNFQEFRHFDHPEQVNSTRFSADGRLLLTAARDGVARVWDIATSKVVTAVRHSQKLWFADFSPDARYIVTAGEDNAARVWTTNGVLVSALPHPSWVYSASFSPDSQRVVTACADHLARVWERDGKRIYPDLPHGDLVRSAEFSPDGRYIVTASTDGCARIWDAHKLIPIRGNSIIRAGERLSRATFSSDGRCLLTTSFDGLIEVWDFADGFLPPLLRACTWSKDHSHFGISESNRTDVYDTATGRQVGTITGNYSRLELNNDGKFALGFRPGIHSHNYHADFLTIGDAREVRTPIQLEPGNAIAITLDGAKIATSSNRVVWVLNLFPSVSTLCSFTNNEPVKALYFDNSGTKLIAQAQNSVTVWLIPEGRKAYGELTCSAPICNSELSQDNRFLIACGRDDLFTRCSAQMWNLADGSRLGVPLCHRDGVTCATFSRDSTLVATAGEDFEAIIWNRQTCDPVAAPARHQGIVEFVAFDETGRWFVTAGHDNVARVWSTETGDPLTPKLSCQSDLKAVEFTDSGNALVVQDMQGKAAIWPLVVNTNSIDELMELAQILTAGQVSEYGRINRPLEQSLAVEWRGLQLHHPDQFSCTAEDVRHWHEAAESESELSGDAFAAKFHQQYLDHQPGK